MGGGGWGGLMGGGRKESWVEKTPGPRQSVPLVRSSIPYVALNATLFCHCYPWCWPEMFSLFHSKEGAKNDLPKDSLLLLVFQ